MLAIPTEKRDEPKGSQFQGMKVSALGMGNMRLPVLGGNDGKIDADKQPECCINCHSCEKVCPQTIRIPEHLKKFAAKMGRA